MEQTFPETSLAFAAYVNDAVMAAIHVAIGAHPYIALLQHIKPGLSQLPRCRNQLGAGVFAVLDEDEGESDDVCTFSLG